MKPVSFMAMLSHDALDRAIKNSNHWLHQQTIDSFLECADRLLVRILHPTPEGHTDVQRLMGLESTLLDGAKKMVAQGTLPMPDVFIVMLALEQVKGEYLHEWRELIAPAARTWARNVHLPEPYRSAALYWASLLGWIDHWKPGAPPKEEIYRMYHHTHQVYYASGYGVKPVENSNLATEEHFLRQNWRKYTDNADLTAEVLLALLALKSLDKPLCKEVSTALLDLQQANGAFTLKGGEKEHHHHATCVAWLALSRYRDMIWQSEG